MKYTARFCHLEYLPKYNAGDPIAEGMIIGRMGSSGQSSANHLHFDVVEGFVDKLIYLYQIGPDKEYKPSKQQLDYFIEPPHMFIVEPVITTEWCDPEYLRVYGKLHHGLDLVPEDRHRTTDHFDIHWNRSMIGSVLKKGYAPNSYGNYILIGFDT